MYEIKQINSSAETGGIVNQINSVISEKFAENGLIVVWLNYSVLFGILKEGEKNFYQGQTPDWGKHLIRLRVFNEQKELLIWKSNKNFKYRLRVDEPKGEETEFIDAKQIIWGTKSVPLDGVFSKIQEDRGVEFIIPFSNLNLSVNKRLVLITRNYLDYNEIKQVGIVDTRFVKIECQEV
jgi:CRISPR-associated protein (TIGR03984 family)